MDQPRDPKGTRTGGRYTAREHAEAVVELDPSPGTATVWPATERRVVTWRTNPDQRGTDGRRPNREDRLLTRVEAEVPARIADLDVHLPPSLAAACAAAQDEITRLDAEYGGRLAGLSSFLVRSESVASSRIEHVYADLDDIAKASVDESASRSATSTIAAAAAMTALVDHHAPGAPVNEEELLRAHGILLADDLLESRHAGRYRDMQNWIGGSDFSPRDAVHVPPPPDEVRPLMADLAGFASRDDVAPLAQAAIAHAQFEAIHPFTDGNGRVGRGLIAVVLRRRGVTRRIVIPVASAMLADVDAYFESLISYRHGDAEQMIDYLARASATAAQESRVSAQALDALPARWTATVRPRANSSAERLLAGLLENPVLDAKSAGQITGSAPPRTYEAIDRLVDHGVLREVTGSARGRVWVADDVMAEVADLDARIGQRAKPSARWR